MSISVSNISAMRALPTTSFVASTVVNTVYVETVGDFFRFKAGSTVALQSNVVVASSDGLGQWTRMGIPNQTFQAALFWAVDPSNASSIASDENTGWSNVSLADARLRPLLTFGELNRRLIAYGATTGTVVVQIAVMSSDADIPLLSNLNGRSGTNRFVLVGDMTQFGGDYTTTAYADAVPAANTGYLLSAVGIGGGGNLGKLVTNAAQTKFAFILQAISANQALITQPHSFDPVTRAGATTGVAFTVGETLRVWSLPSLSQYPFPGGRSAQIPSIWKCQVLRSTLSTSQVDASFALVSCDLQGQFWVGGVGTVTGSCFQGSDSAWYGEQANLRNCGTRTNDLNVGGNISITNNLTLSGANSALNISAETNVQMLPNASIGLFVVGSVGSYGINMGHGGQFNCFGNNAIFGNSDSNVLTLGTQCKATIDVANFFATSVTAAINVHGINYALASVPIVDAANGCGCFDL